ncbi:MAG TPA: hypothetical protein VN380_08350 [Thermoanaerobaculia bacterium]|jgi:hypothetical protein|nr:hypothetical protein [Thermoanaerobaculia bacterium]
MHRTICISALLLLAGFQCLAADVHLGSEVALGPALNTGSPQAQVRLAHASAHLLAVWVSDQRLTGALDGLRVDIPLAGVTPTIVGVAGGRTNFLVAYQARMSDFSTPLLAVRVGFDGGVLDAAPIVVMTDTRGTWGGGVAYDGAEFVIATMIKAPGLPSVMHATDIITGRVGDDGTVRTGSRLKPTQTSGIPAWPNIGAAGNRVVVGYSVQFFSDPNLGPWGLSDLQLDPQQAADGAVGETVFPDANSPGGLQSSMAIGPDRVTFAWLTTDGMMMMTTTTINVAQTDLNGAPVLAPRVIAVPAPLPTVAEDGNVAVAWDGSEYLVAWIAPRHEALGRIQGLRLRADGTAIDQQPFDLSPDSVAADIALIAVPEGFAIAYSRSDDTNTGMLRAFVRTLDRLPPPPRRHAAGR